jgi:mannose-6-phosphate isomerase-like protein (cupin superfamily)
MKTGKFQARHYNWGGKCDGWYLLDRQDLSIIQEKMPPGSTEVRHFHQTARQFFYVLSGQVNIEVEGEELTLNVQEGVEIAPRARHRIYNQSSKDVEFLLVSYPSTQGDRVNLDKED